MPKCSPRAPFRLRTVRKVERSLHATLIVRSYAVAALASGHTPEHPDPPPLPQSTSGHNGLKKPPSNRLQTAHTLTALHTTRGLLPRVLSPQSADFAFWNALLKDASDELSGVSTQAREDGRLRVVVYAADEYAGADTLVSALLEDPFSSETENERVRRRWEGRDSVDRIEIEYGSTPSSELISAENAPEDAIANPTSPTLHLNSSFLASLTSPIHFTELRPNSHAASTTFPSLQDPLHTLYTADIPIIVVNPLSTPLSSLFPSPAFPHPLPRHAVILLTAPSPASPLASLLSHLTTHFKSPDSPKILLIDPARAYAAVRALRAAPSDPLHVQRYSDDAVGSGLSALTRALSSVFPPPTAAPSTIVSAPERKATALLHASLTTLRGALFTASDELRTATHSVRILRSEIAETRRDAHARVFGVPGDGSQGKDANKVKAAMTRSDAIVQPALDRLTWWRVLWAPDEVGWRVRLAVRDAWVGIERTLLPALAPLPPTQSQLNTLTHTHLAALPASLRSPLLVNALQQLAHAPYYPISISAILAPLAARLTRFDADTAPLARAAQGLLFRVALSFGSGAAAVVWGAGAGFWSAMSSEGWGAGLLVAVGGLRWAIGRWERARRAWRADWLRVKEASERDVHGAMDGALEKQVLAVPVRACDGVEELVARRADEIEALKGEVTKVQAQSDAQSAS